MKKTFLISLVLVVMLALIAAPVAAAALTQEAEPAPVGLDGLLVQWGGLAGFAGLIALVINILKSAGVVKDDTAPTWSAGLNLVGLALLLLTKTYKPDLDVGSVDSQVSSFVQVGVVVFSYVIQLLASKGTHFALRGVPVVGKSNSLEAERAGAYESYIAEG